MPGDAKGGIKVVLTSPRVAPGLLTRAAWTALADAIEIGAAGTPSTAGSPASAGTSASAGAAASAGSPASAGAAGASSLPGPAGAGRVLRADVEAVVGSGLPVTQVDGGVAEHWGWLSAAAAEGRQVAWLVGDDGEPGLLRVVADQLAREPRPGYDVEILHGSYDVPGARLIDLVRVMDRLRRNCPWDQEQTHESLAKYLLEETYETLEAIDTGDREHLREELGDLLLQVAFHSRVAEDAGDEGFTIDDVAGGIVEKLIRRHPHVFGSVDAADAAAVEANWETIKAAEKQRSSVLEGIPLALPALALADKVLGRAAKVLPSEPPAVGDEDLGAQLLELVREARARGVDAEQALRTAVGALADQIRATESTA
ncbi:MazG family protein [Kribbella sp. NPDC004536]|uniref:MazG family protein n=1 Tax=Kribbella sp. NPDC004536 TaxID=3364106 RepID=UPI00368F9F51